MTSLILYFYGVSAIALTYLVFFLLTDNENRTYFATSFRNALEIVGACVLLAMATMVVGLYFYHKYAL